MSGGASSSKWYNRLLSYEYLAAEHLAGLDRYKVNISSYEEHSTF